mgnify:CR=1 FL=1
MTKSYVATRIDNTQFAYCCECGNQHYHGSNNDKTNRKEYRQSHCKNGSIVEISITDNTVRT